MLSITYAMGENNLEAHLKEVVLNESSIFLIRGISLIIGYAFGFSILIKYPRRAKLKFTCLLLAFSFVIHMISSGDLFDYKYSNDTVLMVILIVTKILFQIFYFYIVILSLELFPA